MAYSSCIVLAKFSKFGYWRSCLLSLLELPSGHGHWEYSRIFHFEIFRHLYLYVYANIYGLFAHYYAHCYAYLSRCPVPRRPPRPLLRCTLGRLLPLETARRDRLKVELYSTPSVCEPFYANLGPSRWPKGRPWLV